MGFVRARVIGAANETLVNRAIPNVLERIRETLIDHFADRRDLSTLTQQFPYLKQSHKTVEVFTKKYKNYLPQLIKKFH